MDEQDPRLAGEDVRGRATTEDDTIGFDRSASTRRTSPRVSTRSTTTPAASPRASEYASAPGADDDTDRRTREIRADIEQTREELSETVSAIQDHLRPGNVAANAADTMRTAATERARDVANSQPVQYVRANPMPAAMVGIGIAGLAWLAFGGNDARQSSRRQWSHDDAWEALPEGGNSVSVQEWDEGSRRMVSRHVPLGRNMARRVERTTAQASSRVQRQLTRAWHDNPLLIGAAALVTGAVVGLAIPDTERENELMGSARDNMLENVKHTVEGRISQVQDAAANAVSRVQDAAKDAVGLSTDDRTT